MFGGDSMAAMVRVTVRVRDGLLYMTIDQYMQFVLMPIGHLLSSPEKPKYFQTATFVLQVEDFVHP